MLLGADWYPNARPYEARTGMANRALRSRRRLLEITDMIPRSTASQSLGRQIRLRPLVPASWCRRRRAIGR